MSPVIWLSLALLTAAAEMFLLTFYLIAVAVGLLTGAAASAMGFDFSYQAAVAATVTIVMACGCFFLRRRFQSKTDAGVSNPDTGVALSVTEDMLRQDGTARVTHRGTQWSAYSREGPVTRGIWYILRIDGPRIELTATDPNTQP